MTAPFSTAFATDRGLLDNTQHVYPSNIIRPSGKSNDCWRRRSRRSVSTLPAIGRLVQQQQQLSSSLSSDSSFLLASTDSSAFSLDTFVSLSTSSSSPSTFSVTSADAYAPAQTATYDAVMPPTETLAGMGLIFILCVVAAWVWSEQVVPVSRTKLALSKKDGQVKAYLDELKASSPSMEGDEVPPQEQLLATADANRNHLDENGTLTTKSNAVEKDNAGPLQTKRQNRAFERWLFTDWLENNKSEARTGSGGRKKEPALPILKKAKWNSGDNPVVVAAALMIFGLLFTSIVEQVSALLS